MLKNLKLKSKKALIEEWDKIANIRCNQIESGIDLSFKYILLPSILKLIKGANYNSVLDVGCGSGHISRVVAKKAKKVTGVDMSSVAIKLADELTNEFSNITYFDQSIELFSKKNKKLKFTLAVSNMTLMDSPNLISTVNAVASLLKPGSRFVFSICHPCFWPHYWEYMDKPWFNYNEEILIENEFRISLEKKSGLFTTHFHRPLSKYIECLTSAGFTIDEVLEPLPDLRIEKKYPEKWKYPRFLLMSCTLHKN